MMETTQETMEKIEDAIALLLELRMELVMLKYRLSTQSTITEDK